MSVLRIHRPRPIIGWANYSTVWIDGVECGELWGKQVKVFQVTPGPHQVEMKSGWGIGFGSRVVSVDVEPEGEVDLICAWLPGVFGWPTLRPASAKQKARMRSLIAPSPIPRNLGEVGLSSLEEPPE